MNRMSSLPIAEFCGLSPRLGEQHGAGRAAAMSTVFHARMAGEEPSEHCLTEEEVAEIDTWLEPADVTVDDSPLLAYADATKEREVRIVINDGTYVGESVGHCDMYWIVDGTAYIGDIKKSRWTVGRPDTLQLLAYAYTIAEEVGCHSFYCGIWAAEEGEWSWSHGYSMFTDGDEVFDRISAAATNTAEVGSTGPHCSNCWERMHCKEYLLPVSKDSWLAPLSEHTELTNDNAVEILERVQQAENLIKAVKDSLKEFSRRSGGLMDAKRGMIWRPYQVKGRAKVISAKEILEKFPLLADELIKQGAPHSRYDWRKP